MPLTDTTLRNAKPKDKTYKLYDEAGLFIQLTPTGGKWWRFKYRFDGKEKLLSLGTYPDISLKTARGKRDDAWKLLADGVDPGQNRKAAKQSKQTNAANSFEVITREWLTSHMADKTESHQQRTLRRLEVYLFPWIGSKPITDITVNRPYYPRQSPAPRNNAFHTLLAIGHY